MHRYIFIYTSLIHGKKNIYVHVQKLTRLSRLSRSPSPTITPHSLHNTSPGCPHRTRTPVGLYVLSVNPGDNAAEVTLTSLKLDMIACVLVLFFIFLFCVLCVITSSLEFPRTMLLITLASARRAAVAFPNLQSKPIHCKVRLFARRNSCRCVEKSDSRIFGSPLTR